MSVGDKGQVPDVLCIDSTIAIGHYVLNSLYDSCSVNAEEYEKGPNSSPF